jgi:hypothetical protein
MSVLMVLAAGGISGFTMFGAQRELQKAADQAAVAAAAALPPVYPNVLLDSLPFPMSVANKALNPAYSILGNVGLDVPRLTDLVPDPRAVACAYGQNALSKESAPMVDAFGSAPTSPPATICTDQRISVSMHNTPIFDCIQSIVGSLTSTIQSVPALGPYLSQILGVVLTPVNNLVNGLNAAVPAVLTPEVKVDIQSGFKPPLLSMITGKDGFQFKVSATAHRRLKNAVVVPIVAGQGVASINPNTYLSTLQAPLVNTIGTVNTQLNTLTSALHLPNCNNMLTDVQQSVGDIYNPPTGPAPKAIDIVKESILATQSAAGRAGVSANQLAGDTFYIIGVGGTPQSITSLVSNQIPLIGPLIASLLGPVVGSLQIPTLDVAMVTFSDLGSGNYKATIIDAANARGAFRATLVQ